MDDNYFIKFETDIAMKHRTRDNTTQYKIYELTRKQTDYGYQIHKYCKRSTKRNLESLSISAKWSFIDNLWQDIDSL